MVYSCSALLRPVPTAQFGSWQSLGVSSATGGVAVADIEGRIHVFDVAPNERDIRERIKPEMTALHLARHERLQRQLPRCRPLRLHPARVVPPYS